MNVSVSHSEVCLSKIFMEIVSFGYWKVNKWTIDTIIWKLQLITIKTYGIIKGISAMGNVFVKDLITFSYTISVTPQSSYFIFN